MFFFVVCVCKTRFAQRAHKNVHFARARATPSCIICENVKHNIIVVSFGCKFGLIVVDCRNCIREQRLRIPAGGGGLAMYDRILSYCDNNE